MFGDAPTPAMPDIATTSNRGLIPIQSADELLQQDQDAIKEAEDEQSQPIILSLAAHIKTVWQDHKSAKEQDIEPRLLNCLRLRKGVYSAAVKANITVQGGTDVFIKLTKTKCRAAKSWMKDIFLSQEKPFALTPTPVPDLQGDAEQRVTAEISAKYQESFMVHQQAGVNFDEKAFEEQAERYKRDVLQAMKDQAQAENEELENEIHDDLTEDGFYEALDALLWDITTFPACVLKGPVTRMKKTLKWGEEGQPIVDELPKKHWERLSPFDIYPSRTAKNIQDGDFIERHRLSRQVLHDLIGVDGYSEEAIRSVLASHDTGGLKLWLANDQERQQLENKPLEAGRSELIDALQFWGSISGDKLIEWGGGEEEGLNSTDQYSIEAWLVGDVVISAMLNPDPLGRRPYFSASYDDNPDSIWGEGPPELMNDVQGICNSFARAMVNNAGIASGPQVVVLSDLLQPGMDVTTMFPWKVWEFKAEQFASGQMPIDFFQPNLILEPLQRAYDYFCKQASEVTGIPAYIYGSEKVGGAGRALANYEKVLTPRGLVDISLLKVDDLVVNSYGSFSKVTGVHPQGESDIFRLKFNNGKYVDCDMEHRWLVRTHHDRKFRVLTTEEILDIGLFRKTKKGYRNPSGFRPKWMLPLIDFVEFEKRKVKIDPYTMGALIGNGDARCRLTCRDQEIFDRIPYSLGKIDSVEDNEAWTHTVKGIKIDYLSYGLKCKSIEKFIPEDYLYNSKEIRLELLRGLMDTDGCCPEDGGTFYSTSSLQLAHDFRMLVESLGATVRSICEENGGEFEINGRQCIRQKNYRIKFNLPGEKIFHLPRKQDRTRDKVKTHTYITGIEYIGNHDATCITVDSRDHLFLCANFIPTHNTATGLSMLMNAANKGLKDVVGNLDKGVIQPAVKAHWQHIMLYEPDKAKGDINVVARASQYLMMMESLQVRRMEFLNFTNNPVDNQIIGPAGRAEILRETAKSLQLPVDRIIPDKQSIIDSAQEAKIQIMVQNIAKALGAQPERIMQMASGEQPGGGGQPTQAKPRTLNMAGQPMGGM